MRDLELVIDLQRAAAKAYKQTRKYRARYSSARSLSARRMYLRCCYECQTRAAVCSAQARQLMGIEQP